MVIGTFPTYSDSMTLYTVATLSIKFSDRYAAFMLHLVTVHKAPNSEAGVHGHLVIKFQNVPMYIHYVTHTHTHTHTEKRERERVTFQRS
jgi:hypothetical protein